MDEETRHYARVLKAKQDRLFVLDEQAAAYGKYNVPPHIEMERTSLRDELGMVEMAIQAPARAKIGDELGPAGRFLVSHQQYLEVKQSIAAVAVSLEEFIKQSLDWRMKISQFVLLIAITVGFIVVIVVAYVAYSIGKGGFP